jgi:NitT/TauT family transport system substrate-binding protein
MPAAAKGNTMRRLLHAISVGIFPLAVASAWPDSAWALDQMLFQANWLIQGENAYMVAGIKNGVYRDEGIDLSIVRGFGSGDTVKKVVTGAATVGTADVGVIMMAVVRESLPVKCISTEYTYSPQGVWTLKSSGIDSIKKLTGTHFGITVGNSLSIYFPLLAKANGLDPNAVTFVTMEASALLPTLLAGKIDAMPGFATNFDLRNAEATAQGKPMLDMPMAASGVVVNGECEFVTDATIAKQGDLLKRYLRANRKALEWSRDHPEETGHITAAAYPELDEKQVVINHEGYMHYVFNDMSAKVGVGGFDLAELKTTFDAVKSAQNVTSDADVATFIDPRFLPR